ncbi:MAG: DUF1987 domain-containing protein [Bacteroidetes bacterium]|jgi:hypothetical protein|nr:DUF1987 domain-containing protein [Bacteroidota bacterium]
MENLMIKEIPDAPFYPTVNFNAEKGVCEIVGESYMEETFKFFTPLLEWLKEYTTQNNQPLTFNFKLTYFNTSSSRLILDILDILREYKEKGNEIKVNWYYDTQDPDMEDEVEDFMIESGLEIELVKF